MEKINNQQLLNQIWEIQKLSSQLPEVVASNAFSNLSFAADDEHHSKFVPIIFEGVPEKNSKSITSNTEPPFTYADWLKFCDSQMDSECGDLFFYIQKWSPRKCVCLVVTSACFKRVVIKLKKDRETSSYYYAWKQAYIGTDKVISLLKNDDFKNFLNRIASKGAILFNNKK